MILDCHAHSWRYPQHYNVARARANMPPSQRGVSEEEFKRMRDFPVEAVLRSMEVGEVDKALVLGLMGPDTISHDVPNEYLAEAVRPFKGKLYWACCVIMTEPSASYEVERCVKDLGAVALGEIGPGYGHYSIDDPKCFPVYEVARSLDVPLSIHAGPVGSRTALTKYGNLESLDEVCVNFPELKIVLCHLGEPYYEEAIHLMNKHENLYADVSGMPGRSGIAPFAPPVVTFPYFHMDYPLLYYFSQGTRHRDKLLWATDITRDDPGMMKASIEAFRGVSQRLEKMGLPTIPSDSIERMLHENWKKVFTKIKA